MQHSEAVVAEIRAEMARKRVKQSELVGALGLSQPTVSARLAGKTPLDVESFFRICAVLDVRPDEMIRRACARSAA